MGRFGIGARVRDFDGDLCEIIGKPEKGKREVRVHGGIFDGVTYWADKSRLEPANDNISAEKSESAYFGGDDKPVSAWVPKVGDRVRVTASQGDGRPVGSVGTVVSDGSWAEVDFDAPFEGWGGNGRHWGVDAAYLEPVVAPATTAEAWKPKPGDRVNWTRVRGEFDGSIVEAHDGVYDFKLRATNGNHTYAFAHELEAAPFTIEAGKFYRTRDGRKVGPTKVSSWPGCSGEGFAFHIAGTAHYLPNGEARYLEKRHDLVAEWIEPEPEVAVSEATATKPESKFGFTVGDRVRPKAKDSEYVNDHYSGHFEKTYGKSDGTYFVRGFTSSEVGISSKNEGAVACYFFPHRFEPAAPPAKFKVGDRVNYNLTKAAWQGVVIDKIYASGSLSGIDPVTGHRGSFHEDLLDLAPSIPIGSTVTFTATGRLSAIRGDIAQIVFPGLEPGQNSFALPAKYVELAN